MAHRIYGASLFSVKDYGGHAFVKHRGLFYDSDQKVGVKDWRKLKTFENDDRLEECDCVKVSPNRFIQYWDEHGYTSLVDIHKKLNMIQSEKELPKGWKITRRNRRKNGNTSI